MVRRVALFVLISLLGTATSCRQTASLQRAGYERPMLTARMPEAIDSDPPPARDVVASTRPETEAGLDLPSPADSALMRGLTHAGLSKTGRAPDVEIASYESEPAPSAETVRNEAPSESAEDDPPPPLGLTLAQLEAMALASNPAIRQASAVAQKAMGTRRQVDLKPNPSIYYRGQEIGNQGQAGLQGAYFSQQFVLGNKLQLNACVLDQEVQVMLWQAETQRQRVLTDVRTRFYEALGAQERVRLAGELEDIAAEGVRNAKILKEALQAAQPDVLQAEIQLNEIRIRRRSAEFELEANWRRLASVVGVPTLDVAPLENTLEDPQPERNLDALLERLLSSSPDLQQARAAAQQARARIEREEAQPIPNLQVQAGGVHSFPNDNPAAMVQVGITLPLHNRNQGNISRARAEYHRATSNVERLTRSYESQLAEAFRGYQDAQNRVAIFRDEIIPREQESLSLIQLGYPEQFDFLRLLSARSSYFEARIDQLRALVDLRTSEVVLDGLLLTGGLNSVNDTTLDDSLRRAALYGQ